MTSSRREFRRCTRRAALDPLEPRRLLAMVLWDGGGDGMRWLDPLNWSTDQLPGPADDVVIDVPADPIVRLDAGAVVSIRSLDAAEALVVDDASLTLASDSIVSAALELKAGEVAIHAGTLNLLGGGTHGGRLVAAINATLALNGSHAFISDTVFQAFRGHLRINGGASTFNGSIPLPQSITFAAGTFTINGAVAGDLNIHSGATAILNGDSLVSGGTISGGMLAGSGDIAFNGPLFWLGGAMSGSGRTSVDVDGVIEIAGAIHQLARELMLNGIAVWSGGDILLTGGSIHNHSLFTARSNEDLRLLDNGGANALINSGTFTKQLPGAVICSPHISFENNFDVVVQAGRLELASGGRGLGSYRIASGAELRLGPGGNHLLLARSLMLETGASIDINDNTLIIDYTGASPIASIEDSLINGYAGGAWNGPGIRSAAAAASAATAIGYDEASDLFTSFPATFAGHVIDDTAILLRHTFYGDADLDRAVNLADFNRLAVNFGQTQRRWSDGNFNFDTLVNLADFNLLAANFGNSAAPAAQDCRILDDSRLSDSPNEELAA